MILGRYNIPSCFSDVLRSSAGRLTLVAILMAVVSADRLDAAVKPNIVVVLLDDQGWTGTSVQMDPNEPSSKSDFFETPNLESLAAQGMRFSNAYAAGPLCSPSRAAIFTGRSPAQQQMTDVLGALQPSGEHYQSFYANRPLAPPLPTELLPETVTFAERVKQYSPEYTTALFHKDHVGSHPLNYGFDQYDFYMRGYEPEGGEDPKKVFSTANRANAFMEQQVEANNPFVMMVASSAVHTPYAGTAASFAKFSAKTKGTRHGNVQVATMTYDFDQSLGSMLAKIDELGIADNTYFIYTSDNGGTNAPQNNAPLLGGKGSLWEGGVRVPFIVRGPGIAAGSVSNVPVIGTDIYATISALAGIDVPLEPEIESASLVPLFHNGGQLPEGETLSRAYGADGELFFHFPHYAGSSSPMSAVRDRDFKLVRVYSQTGGADQLLLFNLAQSITESSSAQSPLNLADEMPEKTAELLGKLNVWLEGVDASMARPRGQGFELLWDAASPGVMPSLWRSTQSIQDARRESWNVVPNYNTANPPSTIAQRAASRAHQPGLSSQAFAFDGNDLMQSVFLRVSDETPGAANDVDNSVSLEVWFRTDSLNHNQILVESGNGSSGFSLTLGDANGDGLYNDARVRVLGKNGQQLTATAPIDAFADPTRDFIQLTAVVNDSNDSRFVELYVNGALFSRVDGLDGEEGRLDWDGFDAAGLGGLAGNGLGGNGGSGAKPFNGFFEGEISRVRLFDRAIEASESFANYASVLHPVSFGVKGVQGKASVPAGRFRTVAAGVAQSSLMRVMQERLDRLDQDLTVSEIVVGGELINATSPPSGGILEADTEFISYLFHFDPVGNNPEESKAVAGSVEFHHDIIGLIVENDLLVGTDSILGSMGNYGAGVGRSATFNENDFVSISTDQRTLSFSFTIAGDEMVQFRILTSPPTAGDFNGDGSVNDVDLGMWQASVGVNGAADADHDGDSDGSDFLLWQRHLSAASAPGNANAVPEPAGLALFGLGAIGLLRGALQSRRRRQE